LGGSGGGRQAAASEQLASNEGKRLEELLFLKIIKVKKFHFAFLFQTYFWT